MQRERAGDERREPVEQAVTRPRVHGADLRRAADVPAANLGVRLDPREHRVRHEVSEGAFGRAPKQRIPLAHPAGTEAERGLGRAPRQRRAGRGLCAREAFRGERGGAQVGGKRQGRNEATSREPEVTGLCGGGRAGPGEVQRRERAVRLGGRLEQR